MIHAFGTGYLQFDLHELFLLPRTRRQTVVEGIKMPVKQCISPQANDSGPLSTGLAA